MRIGIISDIHSNLIALQVVLNAIKESEIGEIWCLGDTVGYGPEPHGCIELLKQQKLVCIAGNHDLAACGKLDTSEFNVEAAAASRWTSQQLTEEDREFLAGLPLIIQKGDFTLAHGSPREPVWEYILSAEDACENFPHFRTKYCLVGHAHIPMAFRENGKDCSQDEVVPESILKLDDTRMVINPGGVGQPRDGDPRASYAVYDTEANTIILHRIPYNFRETQAQMMKKELPYRLIVRLGYGM